jgi:hypothetical protein
MAQFGRSIQFEALPECPPKARVLFGIGVVSDSGIAQELYGSPSVRVVWQSNDTLLVNVARLKPEWKPYFCSALPAPPSPLEKALTALQSEAVNFANRFIADYAVRRQYVEKIGEFARRIRKALDDKEMTPPGGRSPTLSHSGFFRAGSSSRSRSGVHLSRSHQRTPFGQGTPSR